MDFMKLKATLTLDSKEYEKGLNDGEGKAKAFGGKFAGALKVAKVGAVALGTATIAAAGAVAKLAKQSVTAYAEYEQLTGGIKKLYGEGYDQMMEYANQAYLTAGMSANAYMQNVTGFSAALLNSVGGDSQEAARIADMAMQDISDNANTFGKYTVEELAGVYQALAKGQYQTLDNLNLGFGGTKEGMQGLIDKANEIAKANGEAGDLTIDSYADIVEAIHLVQEEMNITGTTQKEASKTIQGSINMAKAAWENLLTGMADPDANIAELTENFMTSIGTVMENIAPAVLQAIEGIGTALTEMLPTLLEGLPTVIETYLPPLLQTGGKLVMTLINGVTQAAPQLISTAFMLVSDIVIGLLQALPTLIESGLNLITAVIEGFGSGEGDFLEKIGEIIAALIGALIESIPRILEAVWHLTKAIMKAFYQVNWLELGLRVIRGVLSGIQSVAPRVLDVVKNLVQRVLRYFGFTGLAAKAGAAFDKAKTAITQKLDAAKEKVTGWIDAIKGFFPITLGKILSFSLPKITIGSKSKSVGGKTATAPTFDVGYEQYAKAMSVPYMLTRPTRFAIGGESGDEMLYGRASLMRDIKEATSGNGGVVNIYLQYDASDDANDMVRDVARGLIRYKMAGAF